MKIICLCEEGNNRSVACAWLLKYREHEVIPIGVNRLSAETKEMLYNWADRIIITDSRLGVPMNHLHKVKTWNVGPDRFEHHLNKELLDLFREFLEQDGEL